jgi:hypothetical protein
MKEELRLGKKKILHETVKQTRESEVVKRALGISIGLQNVSAWTL